MAEEALLSDLCSICNSNPPKYRCPKDSVRTCSLPCYKRHQQWAQCDGKRDPTAYVKRSQLATAAGIDHDYNFLTGIERAFQRADDDAERMGLDAKRTPHGQGKLQHYLQTRGIIVDRAPVGMSRQKTNSTRVSKSGRIIWTVEWLHEDGTRELHDATADTPLSDLYSLLLQERRGDSRKRKREQQEKQSPTTAPAQRREQTPEVVTTDSSAEVSTSASTDATSLQPSFYLIKPHTPSSQPRVLVPLDPARTLSDALSGQVVLEYPTIKVLSSPSSDPLPEGFVLEEVYLQQSKKDIEELDALIGSDSIMASAAGIGRKAEEGGRPASPDAPVNDRKLLEVLTQDINARK